MNNNEILLVDIFDNIIGKIKKNDAHSTPKLHRAFSVFLYKGNEILIQKRAEEKYHSGGLWANSCCSHPRTANLLDEAKNRCYEEIGAKVNNLEEIFSFIYCNKFKENLYEYEFDHVLVGEYNGDFIINYEEVSELKWVNINWLAEDIKNNPQKYSVWFLISAPKVIEYIKNNKK